MCHRSSNSARAAWYRISDWFARSAASPASRRRPITKPLYPGFQSGRFQQCGHQIRLLGLRAVCRTDHLCGGTDAVVKYVLDNQSLDNLIDADGYTDTVASVSINLYGFVNGVKDCLRQASSENVAKSSWNDGSFSYEAPEFDSNGYKDQVSMTVKDGKITALTWDCVDKDGKLLFATFSEDA